MAIKKKILMPDFEAAIYVNSVDSEIGHFYLSFIDGAFLNIILIRKSSRKAS